MLKPAFQPLLLMLVFGALAWRESHETWYAPVQQNYLSWLQANAGGETVPAPVFWLEIPSAKGAEEAWQPVDFALALNTIAPLQSAVLAIAPTLNWTARNGHPMATDQEQYLHVLHDKLLAAAKPLLSARLGLPDDPDLAPAIEAVPALRKIRGETASLPEYPAIIEKADETLRLAGQTGFTTDGAPASESVLPLVFRYHGQVIPSFVLQAAVLWSGSTLDEVSVTPGESIRLGSGLEIPIDGAGRMTINGRARFSHAKFDDVMLGVTQMQRGQHSDFRPGAWKKSIVLLAGEASATTQAAALATITTRAFPRGPGLGLEALCLLPACWFAALLSRWSRHTIIFATLLALLVAMVLVLTVFGTWALALPLLAPAATILLGALVAWMRSPLAVKRRKRRWH